MKISMQLFREGRKMSAWRLARRLAYLAIVISCASGNRSAAQTSEKGGVLHVQRQEVLIRAIVRDTNGKPETNLQKDSFQIYDNGKLQTITGFSVERSGGGQAAELANKPASPSQNTGESKLAASSAPTRYVAFYFDDLNLTSGDLMQARAAAEKYLGTSLSPGESAGIFTSSGVGQGYFTNDAGSLQMALKNLASRSLISSKSDCPPLDPYEAYELVSARNPTIASVAAAQTAACMCHVNMLSITAGNSAPAPSSSSGGPSRSNPLMRVARPGMSRMSPAMASAIGSGCPNALPYAMSKAEQLLEESSMQSRQTLAGLQKLIVQMSSLPGQKTIVLVSSGFLSDPLRYQMNSLIDFALRSGVAISSLDAKGVYVNSITASEGARSGGRASLPSGLSSELDDERQESLTVSDDGMETLAAATGGAFFHNDNDLTRGFRAVASPPEAVYLLAFAPSNLKDDGALHTLKIRVAGQPRDSVQARGGYFAPSAAAEAKLAADNEMESAIFSSANSDKLPVLFAAQSPKPGELSLLTHIDLRSLLFKNKRRRNLDSFTVATALFDPSGNFVAGREKTANLQLSNAELKKLMKTGVVVSNDFTVKPGKYVVRVVVRDSGNGEMTTLTKYLKVQ